MKKQVISISYEESLLGKIEKRWNKRFHYKCCAEEHTFLHRPANFPHSTRRYKKTHRHINTGNSGTVVVVEAEVEETGGKTWNGSVRGGMGVLGSGGWVCGLDEAG